MSTILKTAISAALSQEWQKAISANQSLLKENKEDVSSMNRLAYAYVRIGKPDEAKKALAELRTLGQRIKSEHQ